MSRRQETFTTHSQAETEDLGRRLATELPPGTTVFLSGELGSGKTTFVRGMARGLGIDPSEVSSPTFVLIQEYRGTRTLFHVDLYRLTEPEVDDLGIEELAKDGGMVAIEWAEKLRGRGEAAVHVRIDDRGGDKRQIAIQRSPAEPD